MNLATSCLYLITDLLECEYAKESPEKQIESLYCEASHIVQFDAVEIAFGNLDPTPAAEYRACACLQRLRARTVVVFI